MKRLFYILLLFPFVLLLLLCPSCRERDPHPLSPERLPIDCDVTILTEKGRFSAHLFLDEQKASLTLCGAALTDGITFFSDDQGRAFVRQKELVLPIPVERLPEGGVLFSALRLPEDTPLLKSTVKEEGQSFFLYTLVQGRQNVLFYLDEQGKLAKIVIENEDPVTILFE